MAITMSATEFRANVLSLLDDVADGQEVVVTKHGRIVARLVPPKPTKRKMGWMQGSARQICSDEELINFHDDWPELREPDSR